MKSSEDRLNALKLRNRDYEFLSICSLVHSFPYLSICLEPLSLSLCVYLDATSHIVTLRISSFDEWGPLFARGSAKRVETSKSKNVASVAANRREKAECFDPIRLVNTKKTAINNNRGRKK